MLSRQSTKTHINGTFWWQQPSASQKLLWDNWRNITHRALSQPPSFPDLIPIQHKWNVLEQAQSLSPTLQLTEPKESPAIALMSETTGHSPLPRGVTAVLASQKGPAQYYELGGFLSGVFVQYLPLKRRAETKIRYSSKIGRFHPWINNPWNPIKASSAAHVPDPRGPASYH